MTLRVPLGAVAVMVLVGCRPTSEQSSHTVEEYRANDALRHAQAQRCRNDPGALRKTPDCVNALEAERVAGIGSFKDLPPLQLPTRAGDTPKR